jgi:hypothetical protein
MVRPSLRVLPAAVAAAVLAIGLAAGPVGATVILRDHYADDYGFSFNDCGFWIDVTGHVEGRAQLRVGTGDMATAFFLHDNYEFSETWTNRATGTWLTLSGNGLFQETRATHIEGTLFSFRSINAGQPFVVHDENGALVARDRGVIRQELIFDTLGDDTPGGEFVADVSFEVAGPHPGLEFDFCAALG